MKKINTLVVFSFLALSLGSCYTLSLKSSPTDHPISLSNSPKGKILKHFTISKTVGHLIFGLVNLDEMDVSKMISDEVEAAGGSEAINVKVLYQESFINGLLNGI